MKKNISQFVVTILVLVLPAKLIAQDVEKIIAMHLAAHGNLKKWEQVKALKITGKFTAFSEENDFTCIKTKNGYYYSDLYLGQHKVKEAFDGKKGWTIDPWMEIPYARKLTDAEINAFYQKAEFFTPFFKYKEKGHKVVYKGKENVDGTDVFVLELTRENGKVEKWFLDAKTYLEYKCESEWVDFTMASACETFFDDFRDVEGLKIPFYVEKTFGQRNRMLIIEKVELNPKFEKSIFEMPKRGEISKLAFIEGKWDVKQEIWTRRGSWYPVGTSTSVIEFTSSNLLEENVDFKQDFYFAATKKINFSYHEKTKKYRLTVFNDLNSSIELLEGEFNDSSFVADNSKISFGEDETKQYLQYVISDIKKDSFVVEEKSSQDKGKTWNAGVKYIYTRKR
jgi:hypothetical protein